MIEQNPHKHFKHGLLALSLTMLVACGDGKSGSEVAEPADADSPVTTPDTTEKSAVNETPAQTPAVAAAPQPRGEAGTPVLIERYLTVRDEGANVDSVAVWHHGDSHWLLATAKDTDQLIVFDAVSGEQLQTVGGPGSGLGQFKRPNGISVIDDMVLVVERDNRRVQVLSLPELTPIGSFGTEQLELPYGLWVNPQGEGYRVYVTDAYETRDEEVPPHDQLDRRLHLFEFSRDGDTLSSNWLRSAGETDDVGVLREVESLWGDAAHNQLLVSDEADNRLNVKVFDLELGFNGQVIGDGLFHNQPEGIAQYACADGSGFWLVADQHEDVNTFRLFERGSLKVLGGFEGAAVLNTDGIWLTQQPMPGFPAGAFYAVHDDGNVGAFDLQEVLEAMGLESCK